jgi:hypothetical protein
MLTPGVWVGDYAHPVLVPLGNCFTPQRVAHRRMCIAPARACPTQPGTTERARRHARMRATRSPSDSDALVALSRNISIIVATREPNALIGK